MSTTQLLTVPDVLARLGGISRSQLYELLAAGELESCKIGRRRLVSESQLAEYVRRLESADAEK